MAKLYDLLASRCRSDSPIEQSGWIRSDNSENFTKEEMNEYAQNVLIKNKDAITSDSTVLEIGIASGITLHVK